MYLYLVGFCVVSRLTYLYLQHDMVLTGSEITFLVSSFYLQNSRLQITTGLAISMLNAPKI